MLLLQVLVAGSIGLSLWFVVALGPPWRSQAPTIAWLQAAWAWVAILFEALLLLALFRVGVPLPVWGVVLFAQDGVFAWRLILLRRSRRADQRIERVEE